MTARGRVGGKLAKQRRAGNPTPELDAAEKLIAEALDGTQDLAEAKARVQMLESEHEEHKRDLKKRGKYRRKRGRPSVGAISGGAVDSNRRRH